MTPEARAAQVMAEALEGASQKTERFWFNRLPAFASAIKLSRRAQNLYLAYVSFASREEMKAWPSLETILAKTELSERSYQAARAELSRKGLICFTGRFSHKSKIYLARIEPFVFEVDTNSPDFAWYTANLVKGRANKSFARSEQIVRSISSKVLGKNDMDSTEFEETPSSPTEEEQSNTKNSVLGASLRSASETYQEKETSSMLDLSDLVVSQPTSIKAPLSVLPETESPRAESITLDASMLVEEPAAKKGRAKKPARVKAEKAPGVPLKDRADDVSKLIWRHCENFKRVSNGAEYMPNFGKDGKAAKALIKTYGIEKCLEFDDAFFSTADAFVKNSGYDFCVFKGVINRLVLKKSNEIARVVAGPRVGQRTIPLETPTESVWKEWDGKQWVTHRVAKIPLGELE